MSASPERVKHYDAVALAAATEGMTAAEFAEMKRDAARYRWLRNDANFAPDTAPMVFLCTRGTDIYWEHVLVDGSLDHHVDEAIEIPSQVPDAPVDLKPADGWIEWNGGECPVHPETILIAKLRNSKGHTFPRKALSFRWGHYQDDGDIIAYKLSGSDS